MDFKRRLKKQMDNCGFKGCAFIAGAFLIVFTFIEWGPAKWIIFAMGIALVLHGFIGDKCKNMCKPKVAEKKVPVKKK